MKNPDMDPARSDEWDDLFRQRFADFQSEPPADVLPRILADLAQSAPAPQSTGWRRRGWLLGLAVLLLLVGTGWLNQSEKPLATLAQKETPRQVASSRESSAPVVANAPMEPVSAELVRLAESTKPSGRSAEQVQSGAKPQMENVSEKRFEAIQQTQSSPAAAGLVPMESRQGLTLTQLASQPIKISPIDLGLPSVATPTQSAAPAKPSVQRLRPVVFGSIMPLYTYQRINPVQNDDVLVKNITTQKALSVQRMGVRVQAGVEWPLTRKLALRTSVTYNQLSQQLSYLTRNDQPDSVQVERINAQTVRLTPYFNDKQVTTQSNWHYLGVGADLVWQLGTFGGWRHYATLGTSVGTYLSQRSIQPQGSISGFLQGGYGIERPLTPTLWLRVAPTVQYGLGTIHAHDGLFQVRPYTYGLTIGLRR